MGELHVFEGEVHARIGDRGTFLQADGPSIDEWVRDLLGGEWSRPSSGTIATVRITVEVLDEPRVA